MESMCENCHLIFVCATWIIFLYVKLEKEVCVIMALFWPNQGFSSNPKGMFCGFKLKLKFLHVTKFLG